MRSFLVDVPFYDHERAISVPRLGPYKVKAYQLVTWISLTARGTEKLPAKAPRLLALLDTGSNHNFSVREEHLQIAGVQWRDAGPSARPLRVRDASSREWDVPRVHLDVWLHSNLPELARQPFPLRVGAVGGACYLTGGPVAGPPIPIIGIRALCTTSVDIEIRCEPTGGILNLRVP